MSADQQRAEKALLRLDFNDAKERLALLIYEAQETAKEFESTATCLRNSPENFEVQSDSEILRYYRDLRFLVTEIKKTIAEKQRRESALIQGGITLP
jgi:hypothetical protein